MTTHNWITYNGANALPDKGKREDENVDIFAYEAGEFCNGPRCRDCGRKGCHHCNPDIYNETCTKRT